MGVYSRAYSEAAKPQRSRQAQSCVLEPRRIPHVPFHFILPRPMHGCGARPVLAIRMETFAPCGHRAGTDESVSRRRQPMGPSHPGIASRDELQMKSYAALQSLRKSFTEGIPSTDDRAAARSSRH